jgi:hypothetical protein
VWTAREEPLPVERGDFVRALPEPGWLVAGTRCDGLVRVFNHGSDHFPRFPWATEGETEPLPDDPHYRKLGYSTATGPSLGGDADRRDADAQVALVGPDGARSRRARIHPIAAVDRFAASCFYPGETAVVQGHAFPVWLERVETVSIARGAAELRVHHAATFGVRWLHDGGFAVADESGEPAIERGPGWCAVRRRDGLTSASIALHGFGDAPHAERFEQQNAFGRYAAAPVLVSDAPLGAEGVFVALHVLTGDPTFDPAALRQTVASVTIERRCVWIACADGARFFVQLVAPDSLDVAFAGGRLTGPVRFARASPDGTRFAFGATA